MNDQIFPLVQQLTRIWEALLALLPQIVLAIFLVVVGYFVARLLRSVTVRIVHTLSHAAGTVTHRVGIALQGPTETTLRVLGALVFWTVLLLFIAIAANNLGLRMFAGWLDQIVNHLPQVVSGILIIFAGAVLSGIARDSAVAACKGLPAAQTRSIARGAQIATLLILVIVGLDQIGIDLAAVIMVLAIVLASILGGLAIAFGLGARTYVSNLIGARHLGPDFHNGARIRFGETVGTIAELTSVAVILETKEGRQIIPAAQFLEASTLILEREDDGKR
ncbi:MAG: hypothetical protein OEO83_11835 [Alphaproteobacteria bacterium]|nr:hypothetical protein [Alphaproteobacteria bacterium]